MNVTSRRLLATLLGATLLLLCAKASSAWTPPGVLREPARQFGVGVGFRSVVFSPDATTFVTTGDFAAHLWDAQTGARLRQFYWHTQPITSATFSPDGTKLLTGSEDGDAILWEVASGARLLTLDGPADDRINCVALNPTGTQALTGTNGGVVQLWSLSTGLSIGVFGWQPYPITSIAMSPDGSRVMASSTDATTRFWDTSSGSLLKETTGHIATVFAAVYTPDGNQFLTGEVDGSIQVRDARTYSVLRTLPSQGGLGVRALSVSADGARVLSGGGDGTATLFNVDTGAVLKTFLGHELEVRSVSLSPDGSRVLTGSHDGTARVWDASTGMAQRIIRAPSGVVDSAISPDGTRIVTTYRSPQGSQPTEAVVWDASSASPVLRISNAAFAPTSICYSPDGTKLLTSSENFDAVLWDATTGALLQTFGGPDPVPAEGVAALAFTPDGDWIITSEDFGRATIWNLATGRPEWAVADPEPAFLRDLAFCASGDLLVFTMELYVPHLDPVRNGVRLWSMETRAEVRRLLVDDASVLPLYCAFSPDGRYVAASCNDAAVRLWDASTGGLARMITSSDSGMLRRLAFSPNSTMLATPDERARVRVFAVPTGQEIVRFEAHRPLATHVEFSRDGMNILSSGTDGTALLWGMPRTGWMVY